MILFNNMAETISTKSRTALLIYCTREEAERIRAAAKRERRTITGFVMNAVMNRLGVQERIHAAGLKEAGAKKTG